MRKGLLIGSIFCLVTGLMSSSPFLAHAEDNPRYSFPQHVAYAVDTIRPNNRCQAQLDDDVRVFYEQWKAAYLKQAGFTSEGRSLYRVSFGSTNPGRTVSEGQGYGMIIVTLMAGYDAHAETIFDGLWQFGLRNPSSIDSRLMDWEWYEGDGPDASAFDGDADIAYGLLLAQQQWGSRGSINYGKEASRLIAGILESNIGPNSRLPMLGDWVQSNGSPYNEYTPRSSDLMPSHFRLSAGSPKTERGKSVLCVRTRDDGKDAPIHQAIT